MYSQVIFIRYSIANTYASQNGNSYTSVASIVFDVCYCLFFLSFPLVGLLADVWIGRYKAIKFGIIMCLFAWIFAGIGYIVKDVFDFHSIFFILYGMAYLIELVGYTSFKANIVQYNIVEEVENVKTIFHMIPLFISMVGLGCADEVCWKIMSGQIPLLSCLTSLNFFKFLILMILLFFIFC